jgi:reactive chlorine resistance protein C
VAANSESLDNRWSAVLIESASRLETAGGAVLRYGLVAILLYFGTFKFTAVEAASIRPLVEHSPVMGWLYALLSEQAVSNLIGASEVVIALLILARRWSPRLAVLGGVLGTATFAVTLSFLFSTPGSWASVPGFPLPLPSGGGGFILKDLFLLGAALWTAGEAARAIRSGPTLAHLA